MASINNVVNVMLLPEGKALARDNINSVAIITSEQGDVLSSKSRFRQYTDINTVAEDFGTLSKTYEYAAAFFSQTPNPVNAGGMLTIGYWRAKEEVIPETSAVLTSSFLKEAELINKLRTIKDGSFMVNTDEEIYVNNADFRTVENLEDVLTILQAFLPESLEIKLNDSRLTLLTSAKGSSATISYAKSGKTGTPVANLLGLAEGSGASVTQGTDSVTRPAETMLEAAIMLKSTVNYKGLFFIDEGSDSDRKALASFAQANGCLIYDLFSNSEHLKAEPDNNIAYQLTLGGYNHYRMLYCPYNQRKMAVAYMSRNHTTNFNGENSAHTMNLKELIGITPYNYNQSQLNSAKKIGFDVYTTLKDVPKLLTSGANDFTDNPYNLMALIDAVQTDVFNLFGTTSTKIAQTEKGVHQIVDCIEKTLTGFVKCGVVSAGKWTSMETFGDLDTFNRNIETRGFYVMSGLLREQSTADRQARKSPVIQVAVKNAGAFHSADIIINFNL